MSAPTGVRGRPAAPLPFACAPAEPAEVFRRFVQTLASCEALLAAPRAVEGRVVRRRARRVSAPGG
jgi:hypothetical protein